MNWIRSVRAFLRSWGRRPADDRVLSRADVVLAEAFRKADAVLRPYTGPERRRHPR